MTSTRLTILGILGILGAVGGAAVAQAQGSAMERLTVHGYLTQGAAATTEYSLYGITPSGTEDYRSAALQVRYAVSDNDNLLIQFSHRRFGTSVLNSVEPQVGLAWAFYAHRFQTNSSVKIGRVPMPRGIYNETRMVGTVLPFYRAPYNTYTESFETIDGAVVGQMLNLGSWSLDAAAYGGGFDWKQLTVSSATGGKPAVLGYRGEHMVGGNLWLNTPLTGVRIGAHASAFAIPGITPGLSGTKPDHQRGSDAGVSVDATRGRYFLRGEAANFHVGDFQYHSYMGQAGLKVLEKLSLNIQADHADIDYPRFTTPTTYTMRAYPYAKDWAVSTTYAFAPNLVAKLEGHKAQGWQFDTYNPGTTPIKSTYGIASIAVSF